MRHRARLLIVILLVLLCGFGLAWERGTLAAGGDLCDGR
jgi:hypothetical protein